VEQEELLMKLLWGKKHPPPHADVTPDWAAGELANRGVKRALPEIIESIRYRNPGERGEKEIWLCKTKIDLLSASKSRLEGLAKALETQDITNDQLLLRWAIAELGKLGSDANRSLLAAFALRLQSRYYDWWGRMIEDSNDPLCRAAGDLYRRAIGILRAGGMTDAQMKAAGLRPNRFFIQPP